MGSLQIHVDIVGGVPTESGDTMLELVVEGDIPEGYECVNINETNYSEHQENIEEQVRKALKEEALQLVKKKPRNEDNQEKEVINNSNEEVSLGDFIGAMGSLMTAFAPKEDAEKLQGQVDQMAKTLSTAMVSTEGTKTSSTKTSPSMETIKHETKSEDQSSFLVAKTNILN